MKGNENYKQKLEAILEFLKEGDNEELYEEALELSRKNYLDTEALRYMLSSSESSLTLDENDVSYMQIMFRNRPHLLLGLTDGLLAIPCTGYNDDVYEVNLDEMKKLDHEDLRELVGETEKYREKIHRITGEYELDMVVAEHGGSFTDFD